MSVVSWRRNDDVVVLRTIPTCERRYGKSSYEEYEEWERTVLR